MSEPVTGSWAQRVSVPYVGANVWGTGINPVHKYRMGAPRDAKPGLDEIIPASEAQSGFVETHAPWGYNPDDIAGLDTFASDYQAINGVYFDPDDRPDLGVPATVSRASVPQDSSRPWGSSGGYKNILRSIMTGPGNVNSLGSGFSYETPSETVSEGWVNKAASGMGDGDIPEAEPAPASQSFVQTSMVQRHRQLSNTRALMRGTDEAREPVASRIAPMILKIYSGQERHEDMFPYQIDQIPRPFWYRRAATGRVDEMGPNEMVVISPISRTPPADPSMGESDLDVGDGGYTYEDSGWY